MVLGDGLMKRFPFGQWNLMQQTRKVDTFGFPVVECLAHIDLVDSSNHFLDRAEAHFGHDLAQLFGDEEEIIDHIFRLSGELLAQFRILGRHADGAGIEVTFAHHDATGGDQRCRSKTEFVGAQ